MQKIFVLLAFMLVILAAGCISNSSLNGSPPEAIREVNASKDGHDGISVYFVLTDKDGKPTTSDGVATLNIGVGTLLLTKTYEVHKSDFKETQGSLQCNLGYIPYTQFSQKPYMHGLVNIPYSESSTVTLYLKTPDGKTLRDVSIIQWE